MTSIFFSESSKNIGGQELQLLEQAVGLKAKGFPIPSVVVAPRRQGVLSIRRLKTTRRPCRSYLVHMLPRHLKLLQSQPKTNLFLHLLTRL